MLTKELFLLERSETAAAAATQPKDFFKQQKSFDKKKSKSLGQYFQNFLVFKFIIAAKAVNLFLCS